MNKWLKPMIFLVFFIVACSAIGRLVTKGETLSDYAKVNPELAYATPDVLTDGSGDSSPSPGVYAHTASPKASDDSSASSPSPSAPSISEPASPIEAEIPESTRYQEGFFYQPLTDAVIARITGISYPVSQQVAPTLSLRVVNVIPDDQKPAVSYDNLRYLNVLYYDFEGEVQKGELICNEGIAQDLMEIFYELYLNEYQIEKIRLIDEYGGDDTASMLDNNTSCFNYRVVDGTENLSKHALGCAIDINPFYNPYVVFNKDGSGETYISPVGSEIYADRSLDFPYKIDEDDLCYKLFKEHGFIWGGNWNSCKDYQHFQKVVEG